MKEIFVKGHTIFLHNVSPKLIEDCIHEDEHLINWASTHVETVYEQEDIDQPIKVGLTYTSRQKIGKKVMDIPCEITEYIENQLVTVTSYTKEGISHSRYIMEQNGEGVALTLEGSYIPSNWFHKLKSKLTLPFSRFVIQEELERLEEYIDRYLYHNDDEEDCLREYTCSCCGYKTLEEPSGNYEICSVCYWEDDSVQNDDPDFEGGANQVSLRQAQRNFNIYGASEEQFTDLVVEASLGGYEKDENFKPL